MQHSEKWREAMRRTFLGKPKSEATRKKISQSLTGKIHDQQTREKMSESHKLRSANRDSSQCQMCGSTDHSTEVHKEKTALARKASYDWKWASKQQRRPARPAFGRKFLYEGSRGTMQMRSPLEVKLAVLLDSWNVEWKYESHQFEVDKGTWEYFTYVPDFYLPELNVFIEVRGKWSDSDREQRVRRVINNFPQTTFHILRSDDIQDLHLAA